MLNDKLKKIIENKKNFFMNKKVLEGSGVKAMFGIRKTMDFLTSWWRILAVALGLIVFLYYPLGGFLISRIDNSTNYEINNANKDQSATLDMMSFLINREVNEKIWTPNLPFFFPSYFLDNMPNYQLGIMSAVSNIASGMAQRVDKRIDQGEKTNLQSAAEFLRYPGTIWMFSPQSSLVPVPSANNQYRKARKNLINYNKEIALGHDVFYKSPVDLSYFLGRVNKDLAKSTIVLETQIRENNNDFFDTKADEIFYYNQGKVYAYYLLLKALGSDYKDIIVNNNLYKDWTQMLKALEEASSLEPSIVRNGPLDSLLSPNHLNSLAFYTIKAENKINKITSKLDKKI